MLWNWAAVFHCAAVFLSSKKRFDLQNTRLDNTGGSGTEGTKGVGNLPRDRPHNKMRHSSAHSRSFCQTRSGTTSHIIPNNLRFEALKRHCLGAAWIAIPRFRKWCGRFIWDAVPSFGFELWTWFGSQQWTPSSVRVFWIIFNRNHQKDSPRIRQWWTQTWRPGGVIMCLPSLFLPLAANCSPNCLC